MCPANQLSSEGSNDHMVEQKNSRQPVSLALNNIQEGFKVHASDFTVPIDCCKPNTDMVFNCRLARSAESVCPTLTVKGDPEGKA